MKIVLAINDSDRRNIPGFVWALKHQGAQVGHKLLLVHGKEDRKLAHEVFDDIKDLFPTFSYIYELPGPNPKGWPKGPNAYWKKTIDFLLFAKNRDPWLWMETDLIPVKKNWATILEKEYIRAGKPFMGCVEANKVYTSDGIELVHGEHMVGIGIYPPDIDKYSTNWKHIDKANVAFDWVCGYEMVPHTHRTPMIHNAFRTVNYRIENRKIVCSDIVPKVTRGTFADRPITKDVILHHGCKDGSLVQLMKAGAL